MDGMLATHKCAVGPASEAALLPDVEAATAKQQAKELHDALTNTAFSGQGLHYQSKLEHRLAMANAAVLAAVSRSADQHAIAERVHLDAIQAIAVAAKALKLKLDLAFRACLDADPVAMVDIAHSLEMMNASLGTLDHGTICTWNRVGEEPVRVQVAKVAHPSPATTVEVLVWEVTGAPAYPYTEGYTKSATVLRGQLEGGTTTATPESHTGTATATTTATIATATATIATAAAAAAKQVGFVDQLTSIMAAAAKVEHQISLTLKALVAAADGDAKLLAAGTALKTVASASRKAMMEYRGDPTRLTDTVRYTVFAPSLKGLAAVLRQLGLASDFVFVRAKFRLNPFLRSSTGYRDILLNFRFCSVVFEIQLTLTGLLQLKSSAHVIYDVSAHLASYASASGFQRWVANSRLLPRSLTRIVYVRMRGWAVVHAHIHARACTCLTLARARTSLTLCLPPSFELTLARIASPFRAFRGREQIERESIIPPKHFGGISKKAIAQVACGATRDFDICGTDFSATSLGSLLAAFAGQYTRIVDLRMAACPGLSGVDIDTILTAEVCAGLGSELQVLSLTANGLVGGGGPALGALAANCPALQVLELGGNQLTGTLDSIELELGSCPTSTRTSRTAFPWLRVLELWGNRLSGSLPQGVAQCLSLQVLSLNNNQFTGAFPAVWGATLHTLTKLLVRGNQLSGSIPASFVNLGALQTFALDPERHDNFDSMKQKMQKAVPSLKSMC
jgi:hypothetical protein